MGIASFAAALTANLGGGLQASFFLPVPAGRWRGSWRQVVVLAALGLLPPLLEQWFAADAGGGLTPQGLPGALFPLPVLLLLVACLPGRRDERAVTLLTALLATALVTGSLARLLPYLTALLPVALDPFVHEWLLWLLPACWLGLAAVPLIARLSPPATGWRRLSPLLALPLIVLPLGLLWRDEQLWLPPAASAAPPAPGPVADRSAAGEAVIYGQSALLERRLAALAPGRPGVIDLFFVGVAADAEQDVFMREVSSIERLFLERGFSRHPQMLTLINHRSTLRTTPLATATALAAALERVGALMGEEDILFLYITTHGTEDHRLVVLFEPLQLAAITPADLRQMLDRAGIRRRVVVVSACYSGGFVEALRGEDSLVITAAAADRTSFGCDNEADFTYFGRAYFEEALRRTDDFQAAFALAREAVAARELAQGYELSDPQIALGEGMAAALAQWRRQRGEAGRHGLERVLRPDSAPAEPVN